MTQKDQQPLKNQGWTLIPPTITIAIWRLRQTWRLLLLSGLGILAAVVLVCVVPLFSNVATSAGFRNSLRTDSNGNSGSSLVANVYSSSPSTSQESSIDQKISSLIQGALGPYLTQDHALSISTNAYPINSKNTSVSSANTNLIEIIGQDTTTLQKQITIISGRLPSTTVSSTNLEVLLTQDAMTALSAKLNDKVTITSPSIFDSNGKLLPSTTITLQVVGTYVTNQIVNGNQQFYFGKGAVAQGNSLLFTAVTINANLLSALETLTGTTNSANSSRGFGGPGVNLSWTYTIDPNSVTSDDASHLLDAVNALQRELPNQLNAIPGINGGYVYGSLYSALQSYVTQQIILQIVVSVLLLQVIGLVLFFVSVMSEVLVDRQTETMAVMRSRGASRRQVFISFSLQTIGLGIIAVIVGPLIAVPLVRYIAGLLLPASDLGALNVLDISILKLYTSLRWYAGVAVIGSVVAMIIAISRASGLDILAARRESARSTRKSLWQRLNLDIIVAIIGLVGYVTYIVASHGQGAIVRQVLPVFALIMPIFLLVSCALIFLRAFPLLTRLGAWIAGRGQGAPAMLALAQLSRSPRQAMRTTLLLALSTALILFSLVLTASQAQRTLYVAAYQVGADFNGTLQTYTAASQPDFATQLATYQHINGVTAASIGTSINIPNASDVGNVPLQVLAPDADTFAQAALWLPTESTKPIATLMQQLAAARKQGIADDTVPAILDDAAVQTFHVKIGDPFSLAVPGYTGSSMHFKLIGQVNHLPGVFDTTNDQYYGNNTTAGGLLLDYKTYAAVFHADLPDTAVAPTTVWLQSKDDATSLASVRAALHDGTLKVTNLADRRKFIADLQHNPLQIDIVGVQSIGAVTAVLLALVGTLTASWISARSRLVNFAVLRALGTTPRQLAAVLFWEQGMLYTTALLLGIGLSALLASLVLPTLVLTNFSSYASQLEVPAIQTIIPIASVGTAIVVIIAICVTSLALMTRIVAQPSISQTLRLNED